MTEPLYETRLVVNGVPHTVRVPARRLLADCLRHDLGLTGTHLGCEHGVCGVGVLVTLDQGLRVGSARAALISVGPVPLPVDLTDALGGQPHDAADWAAAGRLAAAAVDPEDDIHASAAYRRHLAGVLTARAARAAAAHAASQLEGAA